LPFLQHAQQFHLQGQRHAFDFIEEQGAAIRVFDLADALALRTGKCAFLVAEQFRFKNRFGQRAAVDRHERVVAPLAEVVQAARDQFFSRARFAEDDDVGRLRRQVQHQLAHLGHGRAAAHDARLDADPLFQLAA